MIYISANFVVRKLSKVSNAAIRCTGLLVGRWTTLGGCTVLKTVGLPCLLLCQFRIPEIAEGSAVDTLAS